MIKKRSGFTLLELMTAVIIASIGMLGASFILTNSHKDLRDSRDVKSMQENLSLLSYAMKSIIEEAEDFLIDEEDNSRITLYNDEWDNDEKELFVEDKNLKLLDGADNVKVIDIIENLESVSFHETGLKKTVNVIITLSKNGIPEIRNEFFVHLRN